MVAMGTSLADKAWGRESAVYRVSGVFAVIGGWFLTAIIAFSVAGIVAWIISIGGVIMIFVFVAIAVLLVIRTHMIFKRRTKIAVFEDEDTITEKDETEKVMEKCKSQMEKTFLQTNKIFSAGMDGFLKENRSKLKEVISLKDNLNRKSKKQKNRVLSILSKIENNVDSGHFYVQLLDYQREMAHSLNFLMEPLFEHVNNNHKPFIKDQVEELKQLESEISSFFDSAIIIIRSNQFDRIDALIDQRDQIVTRLENMEVAQIKRIKAKLVNTRNSILFFNTITETKNLLLHFINAVKAYRDFVLFTKDQKQ
jgi:Na+/phosphate symporter